jgi:hypothetical protein
MECGAASMEEIAASLQMPIMELATVWREIPLVDQHIAEIMHMPTDSVRFHRCLARKKLCERAGE